VICRSRAESLSERSPADVRSRSSAPRASSKVSSFERSSSLRPDSTRREGSSPGDGDHGHLPADFRRSSQGNAQVGSGGRQKASTLLEEHEDLARDLGVNALVDQIHSSVVDLIGGTGMDRTAALQALEEATGRTSW
jgi:hypothetical protein